jgi:hypothetical protein
MLPAIVELDFVIELETSTAMYSGILAGGPALLPGSLVHVSPQLVGLLLA